MIKARLRVWSVISAAIATKWLVPIPRFESFDALNAHLEEQCLKRQATSCRALLRGPSQRCFDALIISVTRYRNDCRRRLALREAFIACRAVHEENIEQRFVRDLDALMKLPVAPFDVSKKVSTRANSVSMVRFHNNDYSVPVAYAHHDVHVRGYIHEVVIGCGSEIIARHKRSYDKADFIFDPMHYLPLLEQKVGALDQAAPLKGWDLPSAFATLHRLMEAHPLGDVFIACRATHGKEGQTRICAGAAADGNV